jgi:hypothetical protein
LGDKVRVTLIATGYDMSNIPGLDDAVGKKTIDQAIKDYYEKPEVVEEPANDPEVPTNDPEEPTSDPEEPATVKPVVLQEDDMIIDLDEPVDTTYTSNTPSNPSSATELPTTPKKTGFSHLAGWMRGRR